MAQPKETVQPRRMPEEGKATVIDNLHDDAWVREQAVSATLHRHGNVRRA